MCASSPTSADVAVIGGGQSGLAVGYYLRRADLAFVILDAEAEPGGAWLRRWDSLRLFSPAQYSSLPGWPMPRALRSFGVDDEYPHRDHVVQYLSAYEERYELPVRRPVAATRVVRDGKHLRVESPEGMWRARTVVSATGQRPHWPAYPGQEEFRGRQLHSADYTSPLWLSGDRVVVVGGGNSGAQIMAEVSTVAEEATWATRRAPTFLPEDVDGRVLFEEANEFYRAQREGREFTPRYSLGDIVQVPPVREAREQGRLQQRRMFERFVPEGVVWPNGKTDPVDHVIWATGFDPAVSHLRPLNVFDDDGRVPVSGTRSEQEPRLWLVGYGNWTGFASATLIGVGRTARQTVREIESALS